MRILAVLTVAATAGCGPSLRDEMQAARSQIRDLEGRIPPESPLWIHDGEVRFDRYVQDYSGEVPGFLYHHLLRKLSAMSDAEVDAQSRGTFDAAKAGEDPGAFRGRIWRVSGMVGDLSAETVAEPDRPARLAHIAVLFDTRLKPVFLHVADKPEVLTLREDEVDSHAIFVQWIEYVTRSGRRVTAPFFVGKSMRRIL